jgi:predicted nucleotidyltransferase
VRDSHEKVVSYLLSKCQDLPIMSILTYGSYARGDYKPKSDIDMLVVVDSLRYHAKDLKSLIKACEICQKKFHVVMQMDIILDSEIELWNKGVLLDGHSFSDLSFYNKDGKVLFGEDIRKKFRLPPDFREKAQVNLEIIESEFKLWFCHTYHQTGKSLVPHWMTGWLLCTFLNTLGIAEITSFQETCEHIDKIPDIAGTSSFKKYKAKRELTADDFIALHRTVKKFTKASLN